VECLCHDDCQDSPWVLPAGVSVEEADNQGLVGIRSLRPILCQIITGAA
jgi:hypothetical protein